MIEINKCKIGKVKSLRNKAKNEMKWNKSENPNNIYCIKENNKKIGFYQISNGLMNNKTTYSLTHLWILPEYRSKGIGIEVMKHIINDNPSILINSPNISMLEMLKKLGYANQIKDFYITDIPAIDWPSNVYPGFKEDEAPLMFVHSIIDNIAYSLLLTEEGILPLPNQHLEDEIDVLRAGAKLMKITLDNPKILKALLLAQNLKSLKYLDAF